MAKLSLKGRDLRKTGYKENKVISRAIQVMHGYYKHASFEEAMHLLKKVLNHPAEYAGDPVLGKIAGLMIEKDVPVIEEITLNSKRIPYRVYGETFIEPGAFHQMDTAMKLPVTLAGSLMADAHQGYGLPIGGVLATSGVVIPYGVGVDIGCRMHLSIFDTELSVISSQDKKLIKVLDECTLFGSGREFSRPMDDEVLDERAFYEIPILRGLHKKAAKQIGSSGSGNHFVEFGEVEITLGDFKPGKYLGLLSHSGSRGLGAGVAEHYTRIAMDKCRLPGAAKNLAWLDLKNQEGQEYWIAMNLAGDYAAACHRQIHKKIAAALSLRPAMTIANHHNFAWKEIHQGQEMIVHRKGATPAAEGVLGIIPGSMTQKGYIVRGKGVEDSLNSASHGSGRLLSRGRAKASISPKALRDELKRNKVTLIGGGVDEAPQVYKNIEEVMNCQKNLVEVIGSFQPRIVKMDG